jgi:hypothetical protein
MAVLMSTSKFSLTVKRNFGDLLTKMCKKAQGMISTRVLNNAYLLALYSLINSTPATIQRHNVCLKLSINMPVI